MARRIENSTLVRITIVARDRRGLLADSAAVLVTNSLSIAEASASTWTKERLALHTFIVAGGAHSDAGAWDKLGEQLRRMVADGAEPSPSLPPIRPVHVTVQGGDDRSIVRVTAPDQPGLLATICRYFHVHDVNIEALRARTASGRANDTFLVVGTVDAKDLKALLERPPTALVGNSDLTSLESSATAQCEIT